MVALFLIRRLHTAYFYCYILNWGVFFRSNRHLLIRWGSDSAFSESRGEFWRSKLGLGCYCCYVWGYQDKQAANILTFFGIYLALVISYEAL